jgi:tetratricopeptide (TPR) repeat protein
MTAALEAKDWDNLQEKAVALRALTSDPVVIINSLEYEAISYDRRSDRTREIETYRKILDVSESLADPEAREEVTVRAITNKAIASRQLGDEREEFNLWYQLASRFSSSQRPKTVRGVVLALAHIANIHDKRGESDEEIGVHDRIISSYSASGDPEVTRLVARSILNKGACLYNKKLYEQALPLFDQVLSEFGGVKAPAREATIAGAIFNRAKVFEQRGDIRDALSGFRSVVRRYSRSDDAAVQNLVVKARQNVKRLQALNAAEEKPSESGDKEE